MKKTISLVMTVILIASLAIVPATAAHVSEREAVAALETLDLVSGTQSGFEGERNPTRAEALVMLIRLLGMEQAALESNVLHPYEDAAWADKYIGYAYQEGLIKGQSDTLFGTSETASVRDCLTLILRALGYGEDDFLWEESVAFADSIGLTNGEYTTSSEFLRYDMALACYTALTLNLKGTDTTLIEKLYSDGVVSRSALVSTRLASYANIDKTELSAKQAYEKASSAVFYLEAFETREAMEQGRPDSTGSGFFVTADGVALMSYHELDGYSYARATTTDGQVYMLTGVLYYDTYRDVAVVRISKTSIDGETVRFFPYIEIGDSDALSGGDIIYTIGSPLGLQDSISSGIVGNKLRVVDDPLYPCIQFTAPISSGSSGGVLLNVYGEAVGILYGSYSRGQGLNLAVPINAISEVSFVGEGIPLTTVCQQEDAKKAASTLTASSTDIVISEGEETDVVISHDCPGNVSIFFIIDDTNIVSCAWGEFTSKLTVPLTITGMSKGTTTVQIAFVEGYGNPDALVEINVTVV